MYLNILNPTFTSNLMTNIIQIPSSLKHIHIIEEYIEKVKIDYKIDDSVYGNIHLAVVEAVTNAIVHGNKLDESKEIYFNSEKDNSSIRFIIKDQGTGFDASSIPDPTLPENREKISGRGVFLIKNLADNVIFEDNGTSLQMVFQL